LGLIYRCRHIILYLVILISPWLYAQEYAIAFTPEEAEFINEHPSIFFGYEPRWEPYEIYKDGEYQGIVGEYVKILSRETGIDFRPIPDLTWQESIDGVMEGFIMMVPCCAITPERQKRLNFTQVYINDPMVIVVRKDYKYIGGLDDLRGCTIVLPDNYYTTEMIRMKYPEYNIITKPTIYECMEAISFQYADVFIDNLAVVSYYMNHLGFSNLKISAPTGLKDNGIALATSQEFPILRDIAQKVLNAIPAATHSEIRQKWISVDYGSGFFNHRYVQLTIIYTVILLSLIVVFIVWTKTLKKQIRLRKASEKQLMDSLLELKRQDTEKKVLLQEIHHRVKNNLQMVSSMLRLQSEVSRSKVSKRSLSEAVERIKTIALMHDKMYKTPDVTNITIKDYLTELVDDILMNYQFKDRVNFIVHCDEIEFNLNNIVPLGLIVNELVTNSVKYAFSAQENPEIHLSLHKKNQDFAQFDYWDNGTWVENLDSDNFGTYLMEIFTEQLEGKMELFKAPGKTHYVFEFKCNC
jgi:two-component sensor histidine kinase/ABC-type amino acid transport substrate-binding protein